MIVVTKSGRVYNLTGASDADIRNHYDVPTLHISDGGECIAIFNFDNVETFGKESSIEITKGNTN